MNTAVINIKVQPELKLEAQTLAEELGLNLSSLINALLKQVVRTRALVVSATEEPGEYLLEALKESRQDIKAGRISPSLGSAKAAVKWLNRANKKNGRQV